MPELPEVETVRRGLEPLLRGRTVEEADIADGRLTAPEDPVAVAAELLGERFVELGRRGKYLLFGLDSGRTLVVHLRMTGWFHHRRGEGEELTHVRAVLGLDDGATLIYADQRRFGTWRLLPPGELDDYLRLRAGPEPLSEEWTPRRFRHDLAGRRASVKALLLHQGIVAGVGNIYADEALWQARIHPLRPGGELTAAEVRRLHAAVVETARAGDRPPGRQHPQLPRPRRAARRDAGALQRVRSRRRAVPAVRHAHREDPRRPARNPPLSEMHPTALKVAGRLRAAGLDVEVQELDASTRTAEEAAAAAGCELGQIVKSLVFADAGGPVLVLCAGDRRVDTALVGDEVRRATPDEVRGATGFAIGGVPPLGHEQPVRTVVDASLRRFATVWCAAGTPRAVFEVETERLIAAIPQADVRDVTA